MPYWSDRVELTKERIEKAVGHVGVAMGARDWRAEISLQDAELLLACAEQLPLWWERSESNRQSAEAAMADLQIAYGHIESFQAQLATRTADLAAARKRVGVLEKAVASQAQEVCQTLGAALGYPRFCDDKANFPDATEADGVCVGDHVAETMAAEAAARIATLERNLAAATRGRDEWKALQPGEGGGGDKEDANG